MGPAKFQRYVFLRTRTNIAYAVDELADLANVAGRVEILRCRPGTPMWDNAIVLRFKGGVTPAEVAEDWRDPLAGFDYWAIHDGIEAVAEPPPGARATMFFERHGAECASYPTVAQIFLRFDRNDRDQDRTTELIIQALKSPALTVFHMESGRIVFARTEEPAKLMLRRVEKYAKSLFALAITDHDDDTVDLRREANHLWSSVHLSELIDEPDNDNELDAETNLPDGWRRPGRRRVRHP